MTDKNHNEVLREEEAAEYLAVSPRWLQEHRIHGGGPKFVRLTAGSIRYLRSDLDEFLKKRRHASTAEYA